ncbi:unnamed protein product [Peniophora sp. CBMAI 1063]|nr:unnamed protein product [Peniophora sp. CBMAI 1063]
MHRSLSHHRSHSSQSRYGITGQEDILPAKANWIPVEAPVPLRAATVDPRVNPSPLDRITQRDVATGLLRSTSTFGNARRTRDVPDEHVDSLHKTRSRVIRAISSIVGPTGDIAYEVLAAGADAFQFIPVPALDLAAEALLGIWDAVKMIESNRLACLRLTERCADMLLSIRDEIHQGGVRLAEDMKGPITRLENAYAEIAAFLQRQLSRSFFQRYLKRDDIQRDIQHCDALLSDALGMFNVRVQMRMLQLIREGDIRQNPDPQPEIFEPALPPTITSSASLAMTDAAPASLEQQDMTAVHKLLDHYRESQNSQDLDSDTADLRRVMQSTLRKRDDVAICEVMQINRDEMPEAIETLQRTLAQATIEPPKREPAAAATQSFDKEFMQFGIEALSRLSGDLDVNLPHWTITRFEVELDEKIGVGFFGEVYKGRWHGDTVAIKILSEVTPRKLFLREANVWKRLDHPHVLELFGASSATSRPPWFFVSPYYRNGCLTSYLRRLSSIEQVDVLKLLKDIARGMSYLHRRGIIHGDLKASNVLMSDTLRCIVADFGQSELKAEVSRLSGQPISRGTLRWQSPELMRGAVSELTTQIDVYAFGILCVEIFQLGALPWPHFEENTIRHLVCDEKKRPTLPRIPILQGPLFDNIIQRAWSDSPVSRPSFRWIFQRLNELRSQPGIAASSVGGFPPASDIDDNVLVVPSSSSSYRRQSGELIINRGDDRDLSDDVHNPQVLYASDAEVITAGDNPVQSHHLFRTRSYSGNPNNVQRHSRRLSTARSRVDLSVHPPHDLSHDAQTSTTRASSSSTRRKTSSLPRSLSQMKLNDSSIPPSKLQPATRADAYARRPLRERQRIVSQPSHGVAQANPEPSIARTHAMSPELRPSDAGLHDSQAIQVRGRRDQRRRGSSSGIATAGHSLAEAEPPTFLISERARTEAVNSSAEEVPHGSADPVISVGTMLDPVPSMNASASPDFITPSKPSSRSRENTGERDSSPHPTVSATASAVQIAMPSNSPSPVTTPAELHPDPHNSLSDTANDASSDVDVLPVSHPSTLSSISSSSLSAESVFDFSPTLPSQPSTPRTQSSIASLSKVLSVHDTHHSETSSAPPLIPEAQQDGSSQERTVPEPSQSLPNTALNDAVDEGPAVQPSKPLPRPSPLIPTRRNISSGIAARIASLQLQSLQHTGSTPSMAQSSDESPTVISSSATQELAVLPTKRPASMVIKLTSEDLTPSTSNASTSSYSTRTRRGYWNRRGDHLTSEGYIIRAPSGRTYPSELDSYPEGDGHFRNHRGKEAKDPRYRELPGSAGGSQYDKYVQYYP